VFWLATSPEQDSTHLLNRHMLGLNRPTVGTIDTFYVYRKCSAKERPKCGGSTLVIRR